VAERFCLKISRRLSKHFAFVIHRSPEIMRLSIYPDNAGLNVSGWTNSLGEDHSVLAVKPPGFVSPVTLDEVGSA